MAVYASLVSLIHVLNRTQNPPPRYVFLKELQTQPLFDQVSFLLDFVENQSQTRSKEIELLESRITAAAYAAEDIIETFVVGQIKKYAETYSNHLHIKETLLTMLVACCQPHRKRLDAASLKNKSTAIDSYAIFCEDLEKVVQEMDLIKKEVLKINHEKIEVAAGSSSSSSSSPINVIAKAPSRGGKINTTMVGFDEDLIALKDKLTTYQSDRLVIQIVGMGGIGKTTLATNTYDDPFIKSNFDIRAWVTISQDYSLRKNILGLLYDMGLFESSMHSKSDEDLGEKLHKTLFGRKYLIVLDDIWSIKAWEEINRFLPDNKNRSRIMMTTRLSDLAPELGSSYKMKFLDDDLSWNLLSEKIFGKHVCPPELEEIGRIIAKNCGGLPLAIAVIGGLLKVSDKTREYWSEVAKDVSSIVNEVNNEECLGILSLSYNQLPIQLKPLFLYMAIFPEDSEVRVSRLINLWVSEGFLKSPLPDKTLEEVAKKYLEDLIDRNLIMVQRRGSRGNIKTCKIHDLLRDLCLREALKERFLCIVYDDLEKNISGKRRLGVYLNASVQDNKFSTKSDSQFMPLARTVVMENKVMENCEMQSGIILQLNLLRVFHVQVKERKYILNDFLKLVNSRYLEFTLPWNIFDGLICDQITSYLPWNLETLILNEWMPKSITLPSEIWEMQHLRNIKIRKGVNLSMPDREKNHYCVLENLQKLSRVIDLRFTDEILGRIPNLKKLCVEYIYETSSASLNINTPRTILNITTPKSLQKLEILECYFRKPFETTPNFPPMLRKLILEKSRISWEYMKIVGSLPKLEVLELSEEAFVGKELNVGEGEFQCLKSLSIEWCHFKTWGVDSSSFPALESLNLVACKAFKTWVLDSSSFPALESLNLISCDRLEEIPQCIIEIPSLELITLDDCKESLLISAKEHHLEAREGGNYDLLIQVATNLDIPSLESHDKFQVKNTRYNKLNH